MQLEVISNKQEQLQEMETSRDAFETKLDHSIKKIIERKGFTKHTIEKQLVSANGGNYLGVLYEIDIKGITEEGYKELNIFAKNIIELGSFKILSMDNIFNIEMFAYKELSKVFAKLQEEANVPIDERYKMVKAYKESNTEAIIMENLDRKGFKSCNRMDVMSYKLMEMSVKELAKFHALSFVMKEKKPDFFEKKVKTINNPYIFEESFHELVKCLKDTAIRNVDITYKNKVEKAYEYMSVNYIQYANDESVKTCLCHGDYRANNIMVKMDGGELQEIMPVDYQLMHYGSPMYDFLYLIYTGTDREFRKTHMTHLKNLYYDTFSNFLLYFKIDPNVIYSRQQFEKVYNERLGDGLMISLFLIPYVLASETDIPDMSKDQSEISFAVDEKYKERLEGIIDDYVDWGYI